MLADVLCDSTKDRILGRPWRFGFNRRSGRSRHEGRNDGPIQRDVGDVDGGFKIQDVVPLAMVQKKVRESYYFTVTSKLCVKDENKNAMASSTLPETKTT